MTWYFRPKRRNFLEKIIFYTYRHYFLLITYFRSNMLYYFKIFFINKKIKKNKIAILLPSKNRAKSFLRLIKSIEKNTFDKNRLYIKV